jgi:hypothetical protein
MQALKRAHRLARFMRPRKLVSLWAGACVAGLVLAWSASALAGPVWRITTIADGAVAPGAIVSYLVEIENNGDASTDGSPSTLLVSLPDGLTAQSVGRSDNVDPAVFGWSCTAGDGSPLPGASDIRCIRTGASVPPKDTQSLVVNVAVAGGASGVLTSSFDISGGGASAVGTVDPTRISEVPPLFGIDAFDGEVNAPDGAPSTQAGGHPATITTSIDFNTLHNSSFDSLFTPYGGVAWPVESVKDVLVQLPPGLIGNPTIAAKCSVTDLANGDGVQAKALCPPTSQVGTTLVRLNALDSNVLGPVPVFNMVPPPNIPARFGFNVEGTIAFIDVQVRNGSNYAVVASARNISEGLALAGTSLTLWGVPSDSSHDGERACSGKEAPWAHGPTCTSGAPRQAFLRNPTSCTAPANSPIQDGLLTSLFIDSWVHPGRFDANGDPDLSDPSWKTSSFVSHLPPEYPFPPDSWGPHQLPTGCELVPFDPVQAAALAAGSKAGQPSAFSFDLTLPQSDDPDAIGEADLKRAVVTLPAGTVVSPSSAAGLDACTPQQIGLHSDTDPTCPDASKIGSLRIDTPLLDEPLDGNVYLAAPHNNPFDSLLAVYLVAKGPGVVIKLAGKVDADPITGQISTTFDDNPQVPFSKLHLELDGGPRAPLVAPRQCGTYTTHAVLTSWSGKTVNANSAFTVSADGNGAPCPPSQFSPDFVAGTENPVAGATTKLSLTLGRDDADEQFDSIAVKMPTGLIGSIKNVTLCSEAAARVGACTDASKIGPVRVSAGAGPNPFVIRNGRAYITGPYKGAPFGLSIVVPAVAGPFDLGNVNVRSALFVDRRTAQLKVVSDPLPRILQGINLDVRQVQVEVDRARFMTNPTSCAEKKITGTIRSTEGKLAQVGTRFQVGECASLSLKPRLSFRVGAPQRTRAGVSTPLSTTLTQTRGQTNLAAVSVLLPGILNARLPVLNRACTLAEFNRGRCSSRARAGSARAVTPLLPHALTGAAYFVKNPKRVLPDLMIALRGQVAVDLVGKVGIVHNTRLSTRFDTPDVPITKFTLNLVAGRNGPLGIVTNLCSAKARRATARVGFRGQNGDLVQRNPRLTIRGCPKPRRHGRH